MKFRLVAVLGLTLVALVASAQNNQANNTVPRPKLVVGIMVDQMRWDFLYRYFDRYQGGGFKRMLNEGFTAENTNIDYAATVTAIGHSTVYTGSVPSIHGIAGNDFIIQATGESMYCTTDTTVKTVGSTSREGEMSPKNLWVSTITDELRLATNFRSKVIGIALKDRGSILPAGHTGNAAYWFDDPTGNWITSTYYMNELPDWVKRLNDQKLVEQYLKQEWNTLYPISTYTQSLPDNNPYEGLFSGATTPTFPVKTSAARLASVQNTPYGNTFTFDMAKAAIENEGLGKSGFTDFLAVSLSSPDYIGHQYAPNSIEIEDTYLRLDNELADFFTFLDKTTGKGNYTVFLTADHGAAHNVNFMKDNKLPAGLWQSGQLLQELNAMLQGKYNAARLVVSFSNLQASLNNRIIATNNLNEESIRKDVVNFLQGKPGIAGVFDLKAINNVILPDELRSKIVNGYNSERSGVVQIILKPGWYSGQQTGTTHGSLYPYDTHIPLLFMGWGINHGKTNKLTNMTDISPTIAALLHIQAPNGSIGKPIVEVLK